MSISNIANYVKTVWKAGREGGTAWTPARLNNAEDGIELNRNTINTVINGVNTNATNIATNASGISAINQNFTHYESTTQNVNSFDVNKTQSMISVDKIGGYSRKSKNLLQPTLQSTTQSGVTFTYNASDETYTLNGTATDSIMMYISQTYSVVADGTKKANCIVLGGSYSGTVEHLELNTGWGGYSPTNIGTAFTLMSGNTYDKFRIDITSGTVCNNLKIGCIIADDVSTYEPYGLISSKTSAVESVGKNLLQPTLKGTTTQNGITCTEVNGTYVLNGTASARCVFKLTDYIPTVNDAINGCPSGGTSSSYALYFPLFDSSYNYVGEVFETGDGALLSTTHPYTQADIFIESGTICNNLVFKPMITIDESLKYKDFSPCVKSELSVPTAISEQLIGVSETLYNYLEFKDNKVLLHKRVGSVDMGSLNWNYEYGVLFTTNDVANRALNYNAICSYADVSDNSNWSEENAGKFIMQVSNVQIAYYKLNETYDSGSAFKSAMSGQYLHYELATEQIIDVTAQFTNNNLLPIEQGGTVTFNNECNLACPSTVSYLGATDSVKAVNESVNEVISDVNDIMLNGSSNLLRTTLQTTTQNGVTCERLSDGTYRLNGTCTADYNFKISNGLTLQAGTYKMLGKKSGDLYNPYRFIIGGGTAVEFSYLPPSGKTFTVGASGGSTGDIIIQVTNGVTLTNEIVKPMLTTNLDATYDDYEPHYKSLVELTELVMGLLS